jgi:ribosome-associated protein
VSDPLSSQRIGRARDGDPVQVTPTVALPPGEIRLRVSRSSGPGGQHANTSETRVEATFDVDASTALTEAQKRRVVARAGRVLRAVAQDERSQARNRELAVERLVTRLAEALRVERRRVPTRPTRSSADERLATKKHRSAVKRLRRADDDDG